MFFGKPHYATEYRKNTDLFSVSSPSSRLNCQVLPNELKSIAFFWKIYLPSLVQLKRYYNWAWLVDLIFGSRKHCVKSVRIQSKYGKMRTRIAQWNSPKNMPSLNLNCMETAVNFCVYVWRVCKVFGLK